MNVTEPISCAIFYTTTVLQILGEGNPLNPKGYPLKSRCSILKTLGKRICKFPILLIDLALATVNAFIQVMKTPFITTDPEGNPISKSKWLVVSLSILLIDITGEWISLLIHTAVVTSSLVLGILISPKAVYFGTKIVETFNHAIAYYRHRIHHFLGNYHPSFTQVVEVALPKEVFNDTFDASWQSCREAQLGFGIRKKVHHYITTFDQTTIRDLIEDSLPHSAPSISLKVTAETLLQDLDRLNINELKALFDSFSNIDNSNQERRIEIENDFNHFLLRGRVQVWSANFYFSILVRVEKIFSCLRSDL